jgi:glycine cleavage system transcriptional repressor
MTKAWLMLTVVGKDQPGIVAKVSEALFSMGCNFGEASMSRLGGNFTVMLMVQYDGSSKDLEAQLKPISDELGLHCHFDKIDGHLHDHREPNVRISVYGSDRSGIMAHITGTLAKAGLDIYDLESDVGGSDDKPIYIMFIEGRTTNGIDALRASLESGASDDIETHIEEIETVIG